PMDGERLLWFLEGRLYKAYEQPGILSAFKNVWGISRLLIDVLTPLGVFLAAWGMAVLARRRDGEASRIGISLLLGLAPLAAMTNFWPQNPDAGGYLLVSSWILLVLAGAGAYFFLDRGRPWRIALAVIVSALALMRAGEFFSRQSLAGDWSANRQMHRLLEEPEPSSELAVASFSTLSFLRYGQIVEGRRPDLDVRYRGLSEARFPVRDRKRAAARVERELAIFREESGRYTLRPEDRFLAPRLEPRGWFFRLGGEEPKGEWARYEGESARVLAEMPRPLGYAREPLLLNLLLRGMWEGERGRTERQQAVFEKMREIFPEFRDYGEVESLP
ncbi:MAG: hypothetical protein V1798_07815, partial [Pseudomonadota bacterium]